MQTAIGSTDRQRPPPSAAPERVLWVDCARGWCIVLVVMMHSALGVGLVVGETGWLHDVVAFAKPFRMPDFFLVAGLFAARTFDAPWRRFVDRKVVQFAYFYMLWLAIALLIKAPTLGIADPRDFVAEYAWRLVQPFSTTWFIQLLPIFYLVTRAVRRVPTPVVVVVATALHFIAATSPKGGAYSMESNLTGSITVDGFLLFWIYFVVGVRWRARVFTLAARAAAHPLQATALLLGWGVFEAVASARLWPESYGADILFGFLGAGAVVVLSALVAKARSFRWLAYVGQRSLFIYLAFFIPMAAMRVLLLRLAPQLDVGTSSLVVTVTAIAGPLVAERLLRPTPLNFLFQRPSWAKLREGGEAARAATGAGLTPQPAPPPVGAG